MAFFSFRSPSAPGLLVSAVGVALTLLLSGCSATGERNDENSNDRTPTTSATGAAPPSTSDAPPNSESPSTSAPPAPMTGSISVKPVVAANNLVWTVIAVEGDDVLNVRLGPSVDEPIVATLEPWQTSVAVSEADGGPQISDTGAGRWVHVSKTAGGFARDGWINARFVVAQPIELTARDRSLMDITAQELVRRLNEDRVDGPLDDLLIGDGLWVGGFGADADRANPWQWFPSADVEAEPGWRQQRTFDIGDVGDFDCTECRKSLIEFIGVDRLHDETTEYLINDLPPENSAGYLDGKLWKAPPTLHRLVIYRPSTTFVADDGTTQQYQDWQRIHLVFDWSEGTPKIALINVHGWTP